MADTTKRDGRLDGDIDRLIRISTQLYEQLYAMGITWNEAEMIWLNLGSFIFSQGSSLSSDEAMARMKKCVEGWLQS